MELKPTLQQLFDTMHGTCNAAVAALEALPRLAPKVLGSCAEAGTLPACLRWVGVGQVVGVAMVRPVLLVKENEMEGLVQRTSDQCLAHGMLMQGCGSATHLCGSSGSERGCCGQADAGHHSR